MKLQIKQVTNSILAKQKQMATIRAKARSYFAREVYKIFRKAQMQRWKTEGKSEGKKWKKLNKKYARYKRIKYASYKGHGRRMLIGTYTLFPSIVGQDKSHHYRIYTRTGLIIGTDLEYAKYVDEARNITSWSKSTKEKFKDAARKAGKLIV